MKKILFAALAALAITSCSQNEEIEAPSQKTKIDFTTAVGKPSRAADATNDNFQAFTVNSYITTDSYTGGSLGAAYMDAVPYTGGQGSWTTADTKDYFWPITNKVHFFAYPTPSSTDANADISYEAPASGWPTLTFKVAEKAADQKDLVVACAINETKPTTGGEVTLTFKHILTRINFAAEIDVNYDYTISSITIKGAQGTSGTYTFASDPTNGEWKNLGAAPSGGYSYPIKANATVENKIIDLSTTDGSLMLLPQTLDKVTIEVNYTTKKGENEFFNGTKNVTLNSTDKWEIGKNIRYTLKLPVGAEKIAIATEVSSWETPATDTSKETDKQDSTPTV